MKHRNALVTGASTGIGRAIALKLASIGMQVVLLGRDYEKLSATKKLIDDFDGRASIVVGDLSHFQEYDNLVYKASEAFGAIDVLANIAGVWHSDVKLYYGSLLHETPVDEIREVLDINLTATLLLTRAVIPQMIAKRQGKIINISGTFANGGSGWLHYFVSKLAVENFTEGLADELRGYNIQVNCISPSDVATDSFKKYFPDQTVNALDPSEVADLALFLITGSTSDNITGQTIVIKKQSDK